MKVSHAAIGFGLLVVAAWVSAHLVLLGLVLGLAIGYLIGRVSGRRKAVLDTAREIVLSHARTLGEGGR
jgi:ABC-type nitrate/sulfonate/bicarbonate transport system permease component